MKNILNKYFIRNKLEESSKSKSFLTGLTPVKSAMPNRKKRYLTGFTLIEILVVIAIIGVLATMIVANYAHAQAIARDSRRKGDVALIYAAAKIYYDQYKTFNVPFKQVNADGTTTNVGSGCNYVGNGYFNAQDKPEYDYSTGNGCNSDPAHGVFTYVGYPHSIDNAMISQGLLDKPVTDPKTGWTDYMYYYNSSDTDVYAKMESSNDANIVASTDPGYGMTTSWGVNFIFNKSSL